jgi:hypothetical protein
MLRSLGEPVITYICGEVFEDVRLNPTNPNRVWNDVSRRWVTLAAPIMPLRAIAGRSTRR